MQTNTIDFDEASVTDATIAGEQGAFETLYTHYFPRVRALCIRKLGDRELAQDVAQEAFARAFARLESFGGAKNFGGWVWTIATNLCTDHLRRRKHTPISLELIDRGPSYEEDPIRDIARSDTTRVVRLAMSKLEPRHQRALLMHEVNGLSCAAVGKSLGISEVAAESLLARARRRLRKEVIAKAVPADLLGIGLVAGLVRAIQRGWDAAGRRASSVHAAASRGFEMVGLTAAPSAEAAKALVVAVGAGIAMSLVSAAAPVGDATAADPQVPASSTDASSTQPGAGLPSVSVPADTSTPGLRPLIGSLHIGTDDESLQIAGSGSMEAPPPHGREAGPATDVELDLQLGRSPSATIGLVVRAVDDQVLLDKQVSLPDPTPLSLQVGDAVSLP